MHHWYLSGIVHTPFEALFELSDRRLREIGAVRRQATERFGFPCRISLEDAQIGEELLLLPYEHHPVNSPYRASGPIFVRRGVHRRTLDPGEVPDYVARRLISVRAYDATSLMVAAAVCDGNAVKDQLDELFGDRLVSYVHLHNARQGCYSCQAQRVEHRA